MRLWHGSDQQQDVASSAGSRRSTAMKIAEALAKSIYIRVLYRFATVDACGSGFTG